MNGKEINGGKIKTVIFDLDGTLLDTLTDLAESINWTLRKFNLPEHTRDEIRSFVGNGYAKLVERSIPGGKENPLYDAIYDEARNHYSLISRDNTCPYDGIPELLCALKQRGINIAINSNKPDRDVKELSQIYFSGTIEKENSFGENEAGGIRKKPSPDCVLAIMKKFNSDCSSTLYAGDSDVDIETAANAGIRCISCAWGFRSQEFLKQHGATCMIQEPGQLLEIIDSINKTGF